MGMGLLVLVVLVAVGCVVVLTRRGLLGGGTATFRGATRHSVASAAEHPGARVAVRGVARAAGLTPTSEATGREYLARDLRLRPFDGSSTSSTRAVGQAIDFLLDDDSGVALVRATSVQVMLSRDLRAPTTTLDQAPWAADLLRRVGYHDGSPERCRLSVWEGVLAPGESVEVAGTAVPPDAWATSLGARLMIVADDGGGVGIRRPRTPES